MNNSSYSKAYTQVLELLKRLPENEYSKIPKSEIEFLEKNKDVNYIFNIDDIGSLKHQDTSTKANSIIVRLFRDYFATENQKKSLETVLRFNSQKVEKEKRKKYNPDNIFKKKQGNAVS